jgi:hypothetical protein
VVVAKSEEKVMQLVEQELEKNPDASVTELHEKAKAASPAMKKLTLRQFNARFPLQVKRRKNRGRGTRKGRRTGAGARRRAAAASQNREAVRSTFLSFATAIASAEERKDLVKVLADIDRWVDQAIKAAGGK